MTGKTGPRPGHDTVTERRVRNDESRRELTSLDHRYGRIGISAVAAALRYSDVSKNPAYAPAVIRIDWRSIEAVA